MPWRLLGLITHICLAGPEGVEKQLLLEFLRGASTAPKDLLTRPAARVPAVWISRAMAVAL